MKKQKQIANKTAERTITEVTRSQVADDLYFIKIRLYCSQMNELVVADTKMGSKAELADSWMAYQERANRYADNLGLNTYQDSN